MKISPDQAATPLSQISPQTLARRHAWRMLKDRMARHSVMIGGFGVIVAILLNAIIGAVGHLAAKVDAWLDANEPIYGYLIAGHGLYAWGRDMAETLRHLEAFDFLFECELRERELRRQ